MPPRCRLGTHAKRRKHHHGQDHDQILNNQKTDSDAPVERVHFFLVRQELHNDDGAGKGQCYRNIERGQPIKPQRQADPKTDHGSEQHLTEAGCQGNPTQRAHELEVQLEPDQEQQHCDPQFRQ